MFQAVQTRKCKRCGGDLFLEHKEGDVYAFCIQYSATCQVSCDEVASGKQGEKREALGIQGSRV